VGATRTQDGDGATRSSLIRRLGDPRDDEAWRDFDRRYRELVLRYGLRRGLQLADAEDVRQAVMMNLARAMPRFVYDRSRGRFRSYLGRVVRNAVSRFLAGRPAEALVPDLEVADPAGAADDDPWIEEWRTHHLRLALDALRSSVEPATLSAFERLLDGASTAEVAREMGLTEAAVQKIRQRMRDRVKDLVRRQIRDEDAGQDP
jgi:RNA polymerase sigma-70 factor (ECF subfamily)